MWQHSSDTIPSSRLLNCWKNLPASASSTGSMFKEDFQTCSIRCWKLCEHIFIGNKSGFVGDDDVSLNALQCLLSQSLSPDSRLFMVSETKLFFSSAVDCQAAEIFGFRCFVQIQASRCRRISDIDKCSYQGFENRNVNKTMMKTFQDDNMMSATFPVKDAPA